MHQFARAIGFTYLGSGILLLVSPETVRRIILARAEFARLSPGALRLLGAVYSLGGALLVAVTAAPKVSAPVGEPIASEYRR